MGSLALHADPESPICNIKVFGYDASKAALNQFTIHLAYALKDTKIKVNSVHPGWVKSDMGGDAAYLDIKEGSETSIHYSLLPDYGPTGGFFFKTEIVSW